MGFTNDEILTWLQSDADVVIAPVDFDLELANRHGRRMAVLSGDERLNLLRHFTLAELQLSGLLPRCDSNYQPLLEHAYNEMSHAHLEEEWDAGFRAARIHPQSLAGLAKTLTRDSRLCREHPVISILRDDSARSYFQEYFRPVLTPAFVGGFCSLHPDTCTLQELSRMRVIAVDFGWSLDGNPRFELAFLRLGRRVLVARQEA